MAETLLLFGVQKLRDLLLQRSDRFEGVDEQLTTLKSDLEMLCSFLEDADAKKHASEMMRNCVREINEIVFDTEDIIETILLKEELRKTSGIKKHMRRLSCIVLDRREVASDMEGISKRVSKVIRDMQSLGVQQMIVDRGEYSHPLQERQQETRHTFPSESVFVGLDRKLQQLICCLVEEDSRSQVVSITGMGGIGKTTLAKQVFNDWIIKNHFPGLVWVCLSQQFTSKCVWQTILRQLRPEYKVLEMTENELQEKLIRVLETQKALIIIDDIWRDGDWDRIKHVFPPNKGWKVLLTSRNEGVALHADANCVTFKPACLTDEESWILFRMIAFPRWEDITGKLSRMTYLDILISKLDKIDYNISKTYDPFEHSFNWCCLENEVDNKMEKMGRRMIKHCGGLTFIIKVLGGLLAAKYTLRDWTRISHIVGGISLNDEETSSVYQILSLSFDELPVYLKHCFLYLAHFPEDYAIDVEKLAYYWASEEIPGPRDYEGARIRDVTNGYIEEMVKRNMVISERDVITSRFQTCRLHDMTREFCLRKAKMMNFLQILHDTDTTFDSPCKSRRLAVHRLDKTSIEEREKNNPKLRSLLVILKDRGTDWMASGLCFEKLQLMRVLDLSGTKFEGGKLPTSIGQLFHLRYLSLLGAYVTRLPSSIRKLKLLIYLNLCVAERSPIYMSNFLKKLRELRYLSLPREIQDKTKLELGYLIKLETLENFSTKRSNLSDLHGMIRLRTLSILLNGEGCSMETLSSSLGYMQHLEKLTISDHGADKKQSFLNFINLKLKQLKLVQVVLPSHLTTISLRHCCLKEDPMPVLEKLCHLKEVYLGEGSFSGERMVCSEGGFPQLQKLTLKKLAHLEEWEVEEGSMPRLKTLSIRFCDKLKELSDGLRFIPMKELTVVIIERAFVEKLSKRGKDYYKVQHIPVLKIYAYLKNTSYFR